MKTIAVMQPYLFPYIGYFHLIKAVDVFVIFDDVNFIKKGWINRNNILIGDKAYPWTLSLAKTSQNRWIKDHDIFEPLISKIKLLALFERAYKDAPYFDDVFPVLERILKDDEINIAGFIRNSLEVLCKFMGIQTEFVLSSDIPKNYDLPAQDRIIQIIKELKGTRYCNAIGGQELYTKESFEEQGIEMFFVKSGSIHYKQFGEGFTPFLSIIDVLMFNSKDDIQKHLSNYELI